MTGNKFFVAIINKGDGKYAFAEISENDGNELTVSAILQPDSDSVDGAPGNGDGNLGGLYWDAEYNTLELEEEA